MVSSHASGGSQAGETDPGRPWVADPERLQEIAQRHGAAYAAASPFPHVVLDDFLPDHVVERLTAEFPGPADASWWTFNDPRQVKLALQDERQMPALFVDVLREFNGQTFMEFLRELTGIEDLVPDPDLFGGGLHQIMRGGLLKVHADFNLHPRTGLQRRLNALLYLNPGWSDDYGGALELWDLDMTSAVRRVAPVSNRLVVFSTTSTSYHGHPDPLTCPDGVSRKSLALYYYSPVQDEVSAHNTLFQSRPGGESTPSGLPLKDRAKEAAKMLLGPANQQRLLRARRR